MCQNSDPNDSILSCELEYSEKLYNEQISRRNYLNLKIVSAITLTVAIYGATIYIIINFLKGLFSRSLIGNIAISVYVVLLLIFDGIILFLGRKTILHYYNTVVNPIEIKQIFIDNEKCIGYYPNKEVVSNIKENLREAYIDAAIENYARIKEKSKYITTIYNAIICAVLCAVGGLIAVLLL